MTLFLNVRSGALCPDPDGADPGQILCGSDLYVFFHGLSYREEAAACRNFYENPEESQDILTRYHVDYIYVSDYERADFDVDLDALDAGWPLVYENRDVRIYSARREEET